MHHAPAVAYPVYRSKPLGFAMLSVWLASGISLAVWGWQSGRAQDATELYTHLQRSAVALTWFACGVVAAWQWRAMKPGELRFDGLAWLWASSGVAPLQGSLTVALDLQHHLLVKWHDQGESFVPSQRRTSAWLWLQADVVPAHWHGLRCAVNSSAVVQNPPPAVGLIV